MSNSTPASAAWRLGLVGRKVGMTRIFTDDGDAVPVTVIDVSNNRIAQIKTPEVDGYAAVQVAFGNRRASRVNKPAAGHFAKAGIEAGSVLREVRLDPAALESHELGQEIKVDSLFDAAHKVDATGTSIGKAFPGTIKRHNFRGQRRTHGNSLSHRVPGSSGHSRDPGGVFPGKKMAGHMGDVTRTIQNLDIVRVDAERNLLLVRARKSVV